MFPEKIGRYEIKSELGRGGMATVYRAYDPRFKRAIAIKILPREFLHDPSFRARFEREAETIAALEHPAIVPVHDFGEEEGLLYLVMRLMTGGSLAERLARGPLSLAEAARIFNRLAAALDRAHAKGIIHRDLKPGNILFDDEDNPYISDFGIAKLTEASTVFTSTGGIVGTPAYMSPEQAGGERDLDGRSDIYSLGAIVFEMLTGKLPYAANTPMGMAVKHITEPIPRILEARADLPPDCDTLIQKAMAKKREKRFATASELAAALTTIAAGQPRAAQKAEQERLAREKAASERLAREKAEQEKVERERVESERRAREKAVLERFERERIESERVAGEQAELERLERERIESERLAREKTEHERLTGRIAQSEQPTPLFTLEREIQTLPALATPPRRNFLPWIFAAVPAIALVVGGIALASSQAKLQAITQTAASLQQTQTAWALATGTAQAQATRTAWAQATHTAQAQATATVQAQATGTAQAQATGTAQARSTRTAQAHVSETAQARAARTVQAHLTGTAQAQATDTAQARATASARAAYATWSARASQTPTSAAWSVILTNNACDDYFFFVDGQLVTFVRARGGTATFTITEGQHTTTVCRTSSQQNCGAPQTLNWRRNKTTHYIHSNTPVSCP